MHHSFLDSYADIQSPVHRIDPKIKVVLSILLIIFAVSLKDLREFLFIFIFLNIIVLLSNIPIQKVFVKTLKIIPFIFVLSIFIPFVQGEETLFEFKHIVHIVIKKEGFTLFAKIVSRAYLTVFITIILITTTKFNSLLKGFEGLKIPHFFILIFSFMYRYIYLFFDEFERLLRARKSRMIKPTYYGKMKSLAYVISTMFLRTFERSERIYEAMISRGFTGEIITLEELTIQRIDIFILVFVVIVLITVRLLSLYL